MTKNTYKLSHISTNILLYGLLSVFFCFMGILISFADHTDTSRQVLIHIYAPQVEHILMSITIVILASLIFDITDKELDLMQK